jgi:serine/threonine-protein kinase
MHPFLNAVIGEYRITGYLGEGGMGQVYRAVHSVLGHTVAIKVLNQGSAESVLVQRFLNEARIQAGLRHPGVAAFYGFTEYQRKPVIIMEYVDGQTIQEITETRGPWRYQDAVPVLSSCANTLEYIHSQGIVHRDLKSANLKITSTGEVKLLDFGIATNQMVSRLTTAGFVVGSFQSISPEQARGEQAGAGSDIWSFGVLAYEMLTATLPFEGSTQMELFSKIMRASFTPPTVLKPDIPGAMERIISRCLRLRPQDRYHTMHELKLDLDRIQIAGTERSQGQKASWDGGALASSALDRLTSSRRVMWGAILAGAVLIVLLAGVIYFRGSQPSVATGISTQANSLPVSSTVDNNHVRSTGDTNQVVVDVPEGSAEVWEDNKLLGHTPYTLSRARGDSVTLTLHQSGFSDLPVQFDIGERTAYVFPMQRSGPQP